MNPIVNNYIKKAYASDQEILDAASKYYDDDDPEDPKRRWEHVLDDIEVAKKIRGRALIPVELGTLAFHDSGYKNPKGYMWGLKNHPKLSRKIFKKEAPGLGFNDDEIKHMAKVISYHMRNPKRGSPLLKDDLQMLMFGADEGTPKKPVDDARKYFMKAVAGRYPEVPEKTHPEFINKLVERVRTFKDYTDAPGLEYYHRVYPNYHRDLYNYWHSDQIIDDYKQMLVDELAGKSIKQIADDNWSARTPLEDAKLKKKKKVKKAEFDLPDLRTNPKNKMTRLTKNLVWGVKVDGEPISDDGILFKLDPNKGYEIVGDDSGNVASCVDLTNKVVKNMRGVGALATMRSDGTVPHLTPLFKYKGKYYLRSGTHKYSDPYDSLEEIGKRWFKSDSSYPVPEYVDFYDLPAGTIINEKDLRKVIDEVKRKSRKSYRRNYTDREGYNKEKKASKSDEKRLEEARRFVEAVRRMALKKKLNFFLVTDGASGISNNGNPAVRNAREAQIKWELANGADPYEDWGQKQASKSISFPKEEIDSLKGKDYLYTTRVSDDFDKYSLGDSVNTPWGDKYTVTSEDIYDDIKKHKFYKELTPKQKKLLKVYDKIKLIGLKKQAGKLYTYVEPDADLSKGILSARLAPEDALMRRYPNSGAKNKKELLELMQTRFKDDKDRPDLIYALSHPIPDTANSRLLRFRANHKLVSYDTDKIKDLVKLLKRRYRKPPVEVKDIEHRKYIQWGREPKNGAGAFFYAPVYKVLTESGRIDPELLTIED